MRELGAGAVGKGAVGRERRTKLSGGAVGEGKQLSDGRELLRGRSCREGRAGRMEGRQVVVKGAVGIGSCREGAVGKSCREGAVGRGQLP